jgi:amino acid transporter
MYRKTPFVPIVVSLFAGLFWALFMIFYELYSSSSFNWLQNIAVILLSLVVTACFVGLMWVYWIFKRA